MRECPPIGCHRESFRDQRQAKGEAEAEMNALAVILEGPERLALQEVELNPVSADDVVSSRPI